MPPNSCRNRIVQHRKYRRLRARNASYCRPCKGRGRAIRRRDHAGCRQPALNSPARTANYLPCRHSTVTLVRICIWCSIRPRAAAPAGREGAVDDAALARCLFGRSRRRGRTRAPGGRPHSSRASRQGTRRRLGLRLHHRAGRISAHQQSCRGWRERARSHIARRTNRGGRAGRRRSRFRSRGRQSRCAGAGLFATGRFHAGPGRTDRDRDRQSLRVSAHGHRGYRQRTRPVDAQPDRPAARQHHPDRRGAQSRAIREVRWSVRPAT